MFDSKFVATLAALAVAVLAIVKLDAGKKVTSCENFWMNPGRTWKVQSEKMHKDGTVQSLPNSYSRKQDVALAAISENYDPSTGETYGYSKGEMFTAPGTFQSILSPRNSGGVDYGANIRYNQPAVKHQAVPREPLDFCLMAQEGYQENYQENYAGGGCCNTAQSCGKGGTSTVSHGAPPVMDANFASQSFHDETAKARGEMYPETSSLMPVGDMTTINAAGETVQPVVYDRFIYANRNSRNRGQGDPIRGDLPIVPCQTGWFRPSVHPNIDLQEGAMNVMGGVTNETTQALTRLIAGTAAAFTVAGVDIRAMPNNPTMASLSQGETTQALSTVQLTAFP